MALFVFGIEDDGWWWVVVSARIVTFIQMKAMGVDQEWLPNKKGWVYG